MIEISTKETARCILRLFIEIYAIKLNFDNLH